jgi:glycosyltransferase involved in cell wall biosynthesis
MLVVISPEHPFESPASRVRAYQLAQQIGAVLPTRVLPVEGDESNFTQVHWQLLVNTLKLFRIAKRQHGRLVLLVQRGVGLHARVMLLLAWRYISGKRMIFDFDDAIFVQMPWSTRTMCRHADAVTTANEYLADYARRYNHKVHVLPDAIDLSLYQRRTVPRESVPVIGWIGTKSNLDYLGILQEPLRLLKGYRDFTFRIVTDPAAKSMVPLTRYLPIDFRPWTYRDFVADLSTFDIGVCPLPEDKWTRGKFGYKVLEYMALGIPTVASNVGGTSTIIENEVDGYLASSTDDWFKRLLQLLDSPSLRMKVGEAGRKKVVNRYSPEVIVPRWLEVFGSMT